MSGGVVVKQGGTGTLKFTGSGTLTASAEGVVIGAPITGNIYQGTTKPYDCADITFAQTGTITATSSAGGYPVVGSAYGFSSKGTETSASSSRISVQSGTLKEIN